MYLSQDLAFINDSNNEEYDGTNVWCTANVTLSDVVVLWYDGWSTANVARCYDRGTKIKCRNLSSSRRRISIDAANYIMLRHHSIDFFF